MYRTIAMFACLQYLAQMKRMHSKFVLDLKSIRPLGKVLCSFLDAVAMGYKTCYRTSSVAMSVLWARINL